MAFMGATNPVHTHDQELGSEMFTPKQLNDTNQLRKDSMEISMDVVW